MVADAAEGISKIVWRVDGKVKEIQRPTGNGKKNVSFEYDAMGHRVAKHVRNDQGQLEKSTYYVLDASGNAMGVYERTVDNQAQQVIFQLTENYIYGSSRVGVKNSSVNLLSTSLGKPTLTYTTHEIGKKTFELTNHLGNVLSTISDKPIPHTNGTAVDYFLADIRTASDYYPFGASMRERNFTLAGAEEFRFGFQNQEMDVEIKGDGNSVNYTFRMHDPRLGRFFAIDPLAKDYPWNSSYAFSENSVIAFLELEGLETVTPFRQEFTPQLNFIKQIRLEPRKLPGLESAIIKIEQWKHNENGTQELIKIIYKSQFGENRLEFSSYSEVSPSKIINTFRPWVNPFADEFGPGNPEWERRSSGIAVSCSWADPIVGEVNDGVSSGLQGLSMDKETADDVAVGITFIAQVGLTGKVGGLAQKVPTLISRRAPKRLNSPAHLSYNSDLLAKQLASESQMGEIGSVISNDVRDAPRLVANYGGNLKDWVKMTSTSYSRSGTTFETHWYGNVTLGLTVEQKSKLVVFNYQPLNK